MKLVKSLLLGSAAGLVAVAGAQAADLPVRKAAPVDYVRVCTTYGAGYFFIPGTDTCLRISGFVNAEALYTTQEDDRDDFDNFGMRSRFRLNFDARQPTEYGLLRAFIRIDIRRESGAYVSGGEVGFPTLANAAVVDATRFPDQAYIQFGGLTAGRAQSFFDFYTGDDLYMTSRTTSDTKIALFAYTQTFGGGLSATISVEDNAERRQINGPFVGPFTAAGVVGFAPLPAGFFTPGLGVTGLAQEGYEWPDLVANIRIDQAWGAAQLSGAIHQVNALNTFAPLGVGPAVRVDDEWGWAIQAGVMFKLPFLAPGDEFWINAAYSEGASLYNGFTSQGTFNRFTSIDIPYTDAFVDRFGNTQLTEVFSVAGKLKHYWLPNLRSNFHLGYADVNFSGAGSTVLAPLSGVGPGVTVGFTDVRIFEAAANLIWTPVRQLDIGVEALYRTFDVKGNVANQDAGTRFDAAGVRIPGPVRLLSDDDVIEARLRIQRDF